MGENFHIPPPAPLCLRHRLDGLDCGDPALDVWLANRARNNESTGASRTYVLCDGERVIGYYSLAAASILHGAAVGRVRRNMPDPVPAVLIGRLALDRSVQGRGYGAALLRDAVLRIVAAADTIGVRAILVHARSETAKAFYQHFGFHSSPLDDMTLMVTIDDVRRQIRA